MSQILPKWTIKGELILNCNCTVFCPCVVSLGNHPPTEGQCHAWVGIHIDSGTYGDESLSGLNTGMLLDIPGKMGRGNWKVAAYIDERATEVAFDGLVKIFSGAARGTTGLFSMLVGEFLGAERAPVDFESDGKKRRLTIGKLIQGEVEPIAGSDPDKDVVVTNSTYWIDSEIIVAQANKGRVRAHGRVWDFAGRSAEICRINWHGPD